MTTIEGIRSTSASATKSHGFDATARAENGVIFHVSSALVDSVLLHPEPGGARYLRTQQPYTIEGNVIDLGELPAHTEKEVDPTRARRRPTFWRRWLMPPRDYPLVVAANIAIGWDKVSEKMNRVADNLAGPHKIRHGATVASVALGTGAFIVAGLQTTGLVDFTSFGHHNVVTDIVTPPLPRPSPTTDILTQTPPPPPVKPVEMARFVKPK